MQIIPNINVLKYSLIYDRRHPAMENLTLVIMAAGLGSRYGGLKQIDVVGENGEILIDYSIYDAIRAGFNKLVFIITKELDKAFKEVIGDRISKYAEVEYAYQEIDELPEGYTVPEGRTKPWGTAHAVICAADKIKGPFAVINADDFYGGETFKTLAEHLKKASNANKSVHDYCMAGFVLKNTVTQNGHVARGICTVDGAGNLQDIVERTKIMYRDGKICYTEDEETWHEIDGDSVVSMNCWGFTEEFLPELKSMFPNFLNENIDNLKAEFYLPTAVDSMLKAGKCRVKVLKTPDKWFGVTYRQDKPMVQEAIRSMTAEGKYPKPLWS